MPPSEYERSTSGVHPLDVPAALLTALRDRAERDGIDLKLATAAGAIVTTSLHERRRLGRVKCREQRTAVVLCPPWLLWATADGDDPPVALSLHLSSIDLSDYDSSPQAALIADHGLLVSSPRLASDRAPTGTAFIGLGPEPAAESFTVTLARAVADAGGTVRLPLRS